MRLPMALAATAIGLVSSNAAMAQTVYGGVQGGSSWSNFDVTIPGYPSHFDMEGNRATGGMFGGVSLRINENWSAGLEGDANWSDGRSRHGSGAFDQDEGPSGEYYQIRQRWAATVRVRVAYDVSDQTQVYGAAGGAWTKLEARYVPLAGGTDTQTVPGWTAGVGIQHNYSEHLFSRAEVRYANHETGRFFHNGPSTVDVEHASLLLGVGYRFGPRAAPPPSPPPPPPPPPPPAACAASDFVVYFEWDRSNLNQAALDTIDAAAVRARECNLTAAMIIGHTDTTGSADYNMWLSQRRASVVRDALAARGVSADAIQTQGRGETELARQTSDGVREPLNRRAAATISFH